MKVSIITVARNAAATIADTLCSVGGQTHPDIEHIVIDGASTDGTFQIVRRYAGPLAATISEPDRGIYDAMNKGIALAGGDIVGTLNADDTYASPTAVATVAAAFADPAVDCTFADLVYVRPGNKGGIVRYYRSNRFTPALFARGWMPAHPTFFARRRLFERLGGYKTDYRIAADYELLIRFLHVHRLNYRYIPTVLVRMRTGGVSTRSLKSNWILNREIVRACRENGIPTNLVKVASKYFSKVFQLVGRPRGIAPPTA